MSVAMVVDAFARQCAQLILTSHLLDSPFHAKKGQLQEID